MTTGFWILGIIAWLVVSTILGSLVGTCFRKRDDNEGA